MLPGRPAARLFACGRLSHNTAPHRPPSPVPFNILGSNLDWALSEGLAASSLGRFGNVPLCSFNNDEQQSTVGLSVLPRLRKLQML